LGWSGFPSTLKELFQIIFSPFGYLVGIPQKDIYAFAELIGTKTSVNEFIAYIDLKEMINQGLISERTIKCGFANFGSIAVQIAGLGSMAPGKKKELSQLGFKAMFVGVLVNILTATIAGLFI